MLQTLLALESDLRKWLAGSHTETETENTTETEESAGATVAGEVAESFPFRDRTQPAERLLAEALLARLSFRRHYFLAQRNLTDKKLSRWFAVCLLCLPVSRCLAIYLSVCVCVSSCFRHSHLHYLFFLSLPLSLSLSCSSGSLDSTFRVQRICGGTHQARSGSVGTHELS
jgi:hypothetical protein